MSDSIQGTELKLGELHPGRKAVIVRVGGAVHAENESMELIERLLEMGFLEGSVVEVLHEAPFGKDPIAIRVRGGLIALRRNEANAILVQPVSDKKANNP